MDDLRRNYRVTEDDWDKEISDSHLERIALKHCACWKLLPPHLDLESIINDITQNPTSSEKDKRLEFFRKWKRAKGYEATYKKLIAALLDIGERQDAGSVCKLLKQPCQSAQEQGTSEANLQQITGIVVPHAVSNLNCSYDQAPLSFAELTRFFPHLLADGLISEEEQSLQHM